MKLFSNTNWNLYRSFIVVYEAGSYLKAVDILNMARQNIKANITTLSGQLGVELFKSHTKGVTPTDEATRLYNKVNTLFSDLALAEDSVKEFNQDSPALIKMMISSTLAVYVHRFFKEFNQKYPNIIFEFHSRLNQENFELLQNRNSDLAVDLDIVCKEFKIKTDDLFTQNYVFIASKNFLKDRNLGTSITPEELQKLPIIGHREALQEFSTLTGIATVPFIKTVTTEPILPMVIDGTGIGYYPGDLGLQADLVRLIIKGVNIPSFKVVCGYIEKNQSKATRTFIKELTQFCLRHYHNQ